MAGPYVVGVEIISENSPQRTGTTIRTMGEDVWNGHVERHRIIQLVFKDVQVVKPEGQKLFEPPI